MKTFMVKLLYSQSSKICNSIKIHVLNHQIELIEQFMSLNGFP